MNPYGGVDLSPYWLRSWLVAWWHIVITSNNAGLLLRTYFNEVLFKIQKFSFNSLWLSDTIWRHKSGSTLAQVMACCLTAPSHYLNQCWLIISKVQWHSSECNFTKIPQPSVTEISWKITYLKFHSNFPGASEFKETHMKMLCKIVTILFRPPCVQGHCHLMGIYC